MKFGRSFMSKVDLKCEHCKKEFKREKGEHNRNLKKGRKTFCSLSCSSSYGNKHKLFNNHNINHFNNFGGKFGKVRDEYTPFRWFLRCANRRKVSSGKKVNITLEYLKKLWEDQKGRCLYTGWDLVLPDCSSGWKSKDNRTQRASLDRIDNTKGYIEGNVQYVSFMANIAKGDMTDNEMIKFCKAVAKFKS